MLKSTILAATIAATIATSAASAFTLPSSFGAPVSGGNGSGTEQAVTFLPVCSVIDETIGSPTNQLQTDEYLMFNSNSEAKVKTFGYKKVKLDYDLKTGSIQGNDPNNVVRFASLHMMNLDNSNNSLNYQNNSKDLSKLSQTLEVETNLTKIVVHEVGAYMSSGVGSTGTFETKMEISCLN
jgi:hypothetical protein